MAALMGNGAWLASRGTLPPVIRAAGIVQVGSVGFSSMTCLQALGRGLLCAASLRMHQALCVHETREAPGSWPPGAWLPCTASQLRPAVHLACRRLCWDWRWAALCSVAALCRTTRTGQRWQRLRPAKPSLRPAAERPT